MKTINSIVDMSNRIIKHLEEFIPLVVDIDLTYRCTSNCIHCYQKKLKKMHEVDKAVLLNAIDECCELVAYECKISGGDPFVREDIFEILEHLSKKDVRVVLYTSGYYLDRETCKRLADLSIARVEMTFLGPNEMIHDRLANCKGSFQRIFNGITYLKELGVGVVAKYIQMQQNFDARGEIRNLEERLGVPIYPSPYLWCQQGDSEETIVNCRLTDEQLKQHFREYPREPKHHPMLSCGAGKYMVTIAANGDVLPCSVFTLEHSVGNIHEKSIRDIWYHSPFLIELRKNRRYMVAECRRCDKKDFCSLCPAIASWGGADIRKPYVPMCHYAQIAKEVYEEGNNEV